MLTIDQLWATYQAWRAKWLVKSQYAKQATPPGPDNPSLPANPPGYDAGNKTQLDSLFWVVNTWIEHSSDGSDFNQAHLRGQHPLAVTYDNFVQGLKVALPWYQKKYQAMESARPWWQQALGTLLTIDLDLINPVGAILDATGHNDIENTLQNIAGKALNSITGTSVGTKLSGVDSAIRGAVGPSNNTLTASDKATLNTLSSVATAATTPAPVATQAQRDAYAAVWASQEAAFAAGPVFTAPIRPAWLSAILSYFGFTT